MYIHYKLLIVIFAQKCHSYLHHCRYKVSLEYQKWRNNFLMPSTAQNPVWFELMGCARGKQQSKGSRAKLDLCGDTVFGFSFLTVSGPLGPVRKPLSILALLLMCQQWSMSCKTGREKKGWELAGGGPWPVQSVWVTVWLCVCVSMHWSSMGLPKTAGGGMHGGAGRVNLWTAGPFGHIVCFSGQAAKGRLLFQGQLPSNMLPVCPVDLYLTATLSTEWTHTNTQSPQAGWMYMLWWWLNMLIYWYFCSCCFSDFTMDVEKDVFFKFLMTHHSLIWKHS